MQTALKLRTRLASFIRKALGWLVKRTFREKLQQDGWFEHAVCLLLKPDRLTLPGSHLWEFFPEIDSVEIKLDKLPRGHLATPVVDVVTLCKLVALAKPDYGIELGSFKGYTAYSLCQNMPEKSRLVTVDCNPDHGEAYSGTAYEGRIERRIGHINRDTFSSDETGCFDFIFIDADHKYDSVKNDTEAILSYLADGGWLVWHDYGNWGYFNDLCGVPEYLRELSEKLPLTHIWGTNLALYRRGWEGKHADEYNMLISIKNRSRVANNALN